MKSFMQGSRMESPELILDTLYHVCNLIVISMISLVLAVFCLVGVLCLYLPVI